METVAIGVAAGVLGTLVMDLLNLLFARVGALTQMHMQVLGKMAVGWAGGRFRYGHPSEMKKVENALVYGYVTHYAIGVGLAVTYVLGWDLLVGGPPSPAWALAYGVATTAATWFFVFPSLGFGAFGKRSPEGLKATLSSLANHAFYGLGIAMGIALM